jgi:hypothetical protein
MRSKLQFLTGSYVLAAALTLLAFGSTPVAAEAAVLACTNTTCNEYCVNQGYDYGRCTNTGGCVCKIHMCGTQIC